MSDPEPLWSQPDMAWLLALGLAFVLTWAGALTGLPGLGPILAGAAGAWVARALMRRGRTGAAGLASLAVVVGCALAALGLVQERGWSAVGAAFPPATTLVERDLRVFDPGPFLLRLALLALALAATRATRGFAPVLVAALSAAALGAAGGRIAATTAAEPGVTDGLTGIPPFALVQIGGLALCQAGLLAPGPLRPVAALAPARRRLLGWGLVLLAAGTALEPLMTGIWGHWRLGTGGDLGPG